MAVMRKDGAGEDGPVRNKPKRVFGFNAEGKLRVDHEDEGIKLYDLVLLENGVLSAKPYVEKTPSNPREDVDQISDEPRRSPTLAERMKDIDQFG